jgi:hypothetical protein
LDNTQISKEPHENQSHYEDNLGVGCCSLPENLKLHEISDEHMQLLSISTREEMFEGNGCKVKKNGKTIDILSDDTIHQRKEMYSLDMQQYGDRIWDPMLLECQLNCMNEKNKGKSSCCLTLLWIDIWLDPPYYLLFHIPKSLLRSMKHKHSSD